MRNMMKLAIIPVILKLMLVGIIIVVLYVTIDFGSSSDIVKSYSELKSDTTNGFNKKLKFIETYTRLTGDFTLALDKGFTEEDLKDVSQGEENIIWDYGEYSDMDLRPLAQAVMDAMISPEGMASAAPDPGDEIYNSNLPAEYYNVTYNGNTQSAKFRCCTTLVHAMEKLLGNTEFLSAVGENWQPGVWIQKTESSGKLHSTAGLTYGDLQAGDIVIKPSHTEIIVYKDESNVYVANAGWDGGIKSCSSIGEHPGYSKTKTYDQPIEFDYYLRY